MGSTGSTGTSGGLWEAAANDQKITESEPAELQTTDCTAVQTYRQGQRAEMRLEAETEVKVPGY